MSLPILFLDLDGPFFSSRAMVFPENQDESLFPSSLPETIKTMAGYWKMDPVAVAMINKVVEITNAEIVVSSSWREVCSKEDIEVLFSLNRLFVNFHKDWKTQSFMTMHRSREIHDWIEDHPEVTKWVAIDDDSTMKNIKEEHRLHVSFEDGISAKDYLSLLQKIK